MAKINSRKVEIDGHLFDSETEANFYKYLKQQKDVKEIEIQPHFPLMDEFYIPCNRCRGEGKKPSPKTKNLIKCQRCKGEGKVKRQPWSYTGDFKVTYTDGYTEVIDVKGGFVDKLFRAYRKLFEYKYGIELVVMKYKKGKGWVRS